MRALYFWLILSVVMGASFGADAKPLVQNSTGGAQNIQPGQTLFCPLSSGAFSAIPAAATANTAQVYWATDTQTLYRSNGTAWVALTGGGTPGGAAGGDLSGTYPNPGVSSIKGQAVPSLVTGAFLKLNGSGAWEFVSYGTGADQPVAGNDSRLSNARAPTGSASGDLGSAYPAPTVTGIQGLVVPSPVAGQFLKQSAGGAWEFVPYGTGADTPTAGNDSRLSNARAPTGAATGDLAGSYPSPTVAAVNGTALGTTAATAGTILGGNGSTIRSLTMSGDATIGSSGAVTLASKGSAGTYQSVTTDAQGRVVAGTNPTTLAGYGITNAITNAGSTPSVASGLFSARPSASVAGRVYVCTDTGALYSDTGTSWTLLLPALSGDVSTSGTSATLGSSGVTGGTYGSATTVPQIAVDAKGRITSASTVTITPAATSLSGIVPLANGGTGSDLSATGGSHQLLKQTVNGGDVSVAALANADLPTSAITPGTYQSITINQQGIATAGTNPTTLAGYGITNGLVNTGGVPSVSAGLDASKPSASTSGRVYFATDTQKIYEDTGSAWQLMLPAISGDVTTSGTVATLAASGVSAAAYGSATAIPVITIDAKGRATSATTAAIAAPAAGITGTIAVNQGGTGVASNTAYALLAGGTTSTGAVQSLAGLGTTGQILTSNGASALPTFQTLSAGSIGGTAALSQVAVGTGTNTIGGSSGLTFSSGVMTQTNTAEILETTSASQSHTSYYSSSVPGYAFASGLTTPGGALSDTFKISSFINSSLAWGPIFTIDPTGNVVASAIVTGTGLAATGTTASTSTTTGNVINSGGEGIAGAEYVGGLINSASTITGTVLKSTSATNSTGYTTGSIIDSGGLAVNGDTWMAGGINVASLTALGGRVVATGTTNSTSIITGNVVNGGGEGITGNEYIGGIIDAVGTVASTSQSTGNIVDGGGLGVAGAEYVGGLISSASTITGTVLTATSNAAATSTSTGAIITQGGIGAQGAEWLFGPLNVTGTVASTSTGTGSIVDNGGLGVTGAEYVGGLINSASTISGTVLNATSSIASTSVLTGAITDAGGLGVSGAEWVGGAVNASGTTASTSTTTGNIINGGGEGIAGAEWVGGVFHANSSTASTSTVTGSAVVNGGLGVLGAEWLGGLLNVAGAATVQGATTIQGILTAGGTTVPTANTFSGNIIWGRNNAAADTAGAAGETQSNPVSAVACPATGVTGSIATLSPTAGKWFLNGQVVLHSGTTGFTVGQTLYLAISTSPTGLGTAGSSMVETTVLGTVTQPGDIFTLSVFMSPINITSTTQYYLNVNLPYTAGSPTADGNFVMTRLP